MKLAYIYGLVSKRSRGYLLLRILGDTGIEIVNPEVTARDKALRTSNMESVITSTRMASSALEQRDEKG